MAGLWLCRVKTIPLSVWSVRWSGRCHWTVQ